MEEGKVDSSEMTVSPQRQLYTTAWHVRREGKEKWRCSYPCSLLLFYELSHHLHLQRVFPE